MDGMILDYHDLLFIYACGLYSLYDLYNLYNLYNIFIPLIIIGNILSLLLSLWLVSRWIE